MLWAVGKVLFAGIVISFLSWLSGKNARLAGFLTALPLTTLLALAIGQVEWGNPEQSVNYAKSILFALPITFLFFAPFFSAEKLNLGFWTCYSSGIGLLVVGYFIHTFVTKAV
ncbi:MAG: hypothetical protein DRQ89_08945 [Epsilonproteobacteria bacterium]|nr:MAG: hypothetical protein DRQ89_08945 [Campylobacterota bacterium]